jgi:hypothetical protein
MAWNKEMINTIVFQLCFGICRQERPRETGRTENEWDTSVGLEVNSEKTKYMLMSLKKAGQKHCIKIANRFFEGVANFKYLGTTLTDQNYMQEEIKSGINSGNACYHSVHSLLSSRLLSRNVKVKIYNTIILPVVLYGCET